MRTEEKEAIVGIFSAVFKQPLEPEKMLNLERGFDELCRENPVEWADVRETVQTMFADYKTKKEAT